jgi:hypothetical protein
MESGWLSALAAAFVMFITDISEIKPKLKPKLHLLAKYRGASTA